MKDKKILHTPVNEKELEALRAGDVIHLTGTLITGRDAAHKRMVGLLKEGRDLPVVLKNQAIYYVGPCPAPPGRAIGSCGPTTSSRVDIYTPALLDHGLKVMIGKGQRSRQVIDSIRKNRAVYLAATGGAGALIAKCVKKAQVIAFDDLGTEAIHLLEIENLPLVVAIDSLGNNLYETGPKEFKK